MSAADQLKDAMEQPAELPFSEDDLASRFSTEHVDTLRYVAKWSRWFEWDGQRWREDETVHVFDLVRTHCRAIAAGCNEGGKGLVRANTIAAVERMARADRRHALTADAWDVDPWLLNTPAGTVDLRTGSMQPHNPGHYITKMTAVAPGGTCPAWHTFLRRVTDQDQELEAFLQRMVGYCLTGSTREHALFFIFGLGANGKSVFCNTVSRIMADYHRTVPTEIFMKSSQDRHPTELASLQGARLVTCVETEENRRWAESRIKALTGGDPIAARYMRQDFFEFQPIFKLAVIGNYRPTLRVVDEAIRRRFNLVPFAVTIPKAERDPDLADKLKEEWPGILAWAVKGAAEWFSSGLRPPQAVRDATSDYLSGEDLMASWIADRCDTEPAAKAKSSVLYHSFREWCEAAGERPGSQKAFSQTLEGHGYDKKHERTGWHFYGLKL